MEKLLGNSMRLKLAEPEKKESPADIQEALLDWYFINQDPRKWATFDAVQFKHERQVHVEWGVIHSNGMKEIAIQTIHYALRKDGTVATIRRTHN